MLSMILPPEQRRFYQLPAIDHWNNLYRTTAFDIFILIPYLAILSILAIYGIHRYHLVYLYLKNKDKVAQPKGKLERKPTFRFNCRTATGCYAFRRLVVR